MNKKTVIVSFFVLLNLAMGYLFQIATGYRCYLELSIIATTSFIFWYFAIQWVEQAAVRWKLFGQFKHFAIQMGIGLSVGLLNILISSGILFLVVLGTADCTDPALEFLNGTFTNNLTVHLLCYCSLVFIQMDQKPLISKDHQEEPPSLPNQILLSSGNKTYTCSWTNIFYLEASNNCIIIHTDTGNFVRYQSLKSFLKTYAATRIKRVHRSYAVNMEHVLFYEKNKNGDGLLTLSDRSQVKFSRSYLHRFEQ